MAFVLGALMLAYGGFLMLISPVSARSIETGKKILKNTGIGILLLFFSWYIIDIIIMAITQGGLKENNILSGPWNQIECTAVSTLFYEGVPITYDPSQVRS
ncbi:MAG: hypothetical protein Q8R12_05045, partial [bacterium]|nr:hypothetical protein [bacterium]